MTRWTILLFAAAFLLFEQNSSAQTANDSISKSKTWFLFASADFYSGINDANEILKIVTFQKINRDSLYLDQGWGLTGKYYRFIRLGKKKQLPVYAKTGLTVFNKGSAYKTFSIPVALGIDYLIPPFGINLELAPRYFFTNPLDRLTSNFVLEYTIGLKLPRLNRRGKLLLEISYRNFDRNRFVCLTGNIAITAGSK